MHTLIHDPSWWVAAPIRWFVLVGLALVGGASAFDLYAIRETAYASGMEPALDALRARTLGLRRRGVVIAIPANVAALGAHVGVLAGGHFAWGIAWLVRLCALGVAAGVLRRPAVTACAAGLALLTLSASGHAVVAAHPIEATVAVLADWLHLGAAAVWVGGVAVLATSLQPSLAGLAGPERKEFIAAVIKRFSVAALTAVVIIGFTGSFAAVVQVGSLTGFLGTVYGRVVIAKVTLLMVILGIAFAHDREGRGEPEGRLFAGTVRVEALVMLVVLALSALLTSLPPPSV